MERGARGAAGRGKDVDEGEGSSGRQAPAFARYGGSRDYRFVGMDGETDLLGLFEGRTQLIVYRFFYAPDVENWPDGACTGCSMFTDMVGHPAHLAARDTTLAFVTAAPLEMVTTLRKRMGWEHLTFYSLSDDRFSEDFDVKEMFGLNVFIRQGARVFRSYFMNGRGVEEIGPVWSFLDITLLGRQEIWQDVPAGRPQGEPYNWWRLPRRLWRGRNATFLTDLDVCVCCRRGLRHL